SFLSMLMRLLKMLGETRPQMGQGQDQLKLLPLSWTTGDGRIRTVIVRGRVARPNHWDNSQRVGYRSDALDNTNEASGFRFLLSGWHRPGQGCVAILRQVEFDAVHAVDLMQHALKIGLMQIGLDAGKG